MVHPTVMQWIHQTYPKPRIDPDWLNACYAWVLDEFKFDTATQMDLIKREIEIQLLESDLNDSTLEGTGVPRNILSLNDYRLRGSPVLVEVTALTEIGHSAFNLQNVRQTRLEKVDLNGLAGDDADDDEGPIPKYPRTMLRFELSDGTTVFPAIEYRPLKTLLLGETPLGYKMVLKEGLVIRRGIAFLEPDTVILKGHKTEERELKQDADFLRGLRRRLGKLENEEIDIPVRTAGIPPLVQHVNNGGQGSTDLDLPDDDNDTLPRKRRIIETNIFSTGTTVVASPYFSTVEPSSNASGSSNSTRVDLISGHMSRILSPTRVDDYSWMDTDPDGPPASESGSSNLTKQHRRTTANRDMVTSQNLSDIDYDFGNSDDIDDAFLEEIAKVEESALGNNELDFQDESFHHATASNSIINRGNVIILDDDEDEDKENRLNSGRRDHGHMAVQSHIPSSVIYISDSD